MSEPDNPAAFPAVLPPPEQLSTWNEGMDLRDWFAGRAISGMLAAPSGGREFATAATRHGILPAQAIARAAFDMADAMLIERKRGR